MTKSVIYSITCAASGKIYIGSAVNYVKRWADHKWDLRNQKHCNRKLQNSWNKYGEGAFEFAIIEKVEDLSMLLAREQHWIDFHNSYKVGLNMTPTAGSPLGRVQTEATKQLLREINSTPEFKAAHSARHKGKIVSEETRKKQAAAKLGRKQSPETIAKRNASLKAIWEKKNVDKYPS